MAAVVDAIPVLIHISLFLYFSALRFSLTVNYTVAITTTIMTGLCVVIYIIGMVSP